MKNYLNSISAYFLPLFLVTILLTAHLDSSAQAVKEAQQDTSRVIPDTLLFKIQKAQAAITEINAANKKGYNILSIRKTLAEIESNILPVKQDLETTGKVSDTKNLLSYNLILKDAQVKLDKLKSEISKYNDDLQRRSEEVVTLSNDSLLKVTAKDTTGKKFYTQQLTDIKLRLQDAGKSTTANLDTISRLLANVSASYLTITDLQNLINEQLEKSGKNAMSKESPYIWAAPKSNTLGQSIGGLIDSSYQGQHKILSYFINSTWDNRALVLLCGLAFYLWVFTNYKKSRQTEMRQQLGELKFDYLTPTPILATIIVLLNLTPLFEPDSPSLYIELTQFLLLVAITFHLWTTLSKEDLRSWLSVIALYVVLILTNAIINDAIFIRLILMALNIAFLYVGIKLYQKLKKARFEKRYIKPVLFIYLLFNLLSVLLNIFGRISLAKIFSITAVIGLTQVVGLAIFIQIISNALELQMKVSSYSKGIFSRINVSKTQASFKKALSVLAVILWLLVFMINLSLTGGVFALIHNVLMKPRTFGSVSFTLNNVLFFTVIFYISNLLQKHVGILFGESSDKFGDNNEQKSSKVALVRLIIIIIGVLLAVTASGIPMDKLTVVLGALGVGIGLGMQNIVTNFVSGIILIFEKPFQIGDYIELADKKGKVQDIGIRSSKMLTPQGSEVIIPNGDLLSGRLVNWTLTNDYVKTEIIFKVGIETDLESINKIILEEIDKADHTLKNIPPEILINTIAADSIELKVLVWVTSIYTEAGFKSQLLKQLLVRFREVQVKLM